MLCDRFVCAVVVFRPHSEDVVDLVELEHSGGEEQDEDTEEAFHYVEEATCVRKHFEERVDSSVVGFLS